MDKKTCTKCGEVKSLDCFSKDKYKKSGYRSQCKLCIKDYQEANSDTIAEYHKAYYEANRVDIIEYQKVWREANKQKISDKNKAYRQTERGKAFRRAEESKRRATQLNQTPPDADLELIKQIFERCPEGYHVDHVVPLALGGLHHQGNLCYLPASENHAKKDKTLEEFGYERFYTHAIWPKLSKQN